MGDISENIDITVEGADALEEAAAKAEEFAEALKQARDAAGELDAAGEGADAAAEALQAAATAAEEFARAADSARDAMGDIDAASAGVQAAAAALSEGADMAEGFARALGQDRDALAEMAAAGGGLQDIAASLTEDAAAAELLKDRLAAARDAQAELSAESDIPSVTADLHNHAGMYDGLTEDIGAAGAAAAGAAQDVEGLGNDLEGAASDAESAGKGLLDMGANADGLGSALSGLGGALPNISTMGGLIGGLVVAAAAVVPVVATLGTGFLAFGAMALPALDKVKNGLSAVTTAQKAYETAKDVYKNDPTTANLTAENKALATLKATWQTMPAPVSAAVSAVRQFESAWSEAGKKSGIQQDALGDITKVLQTAKALIPSVTGIAKAAAPAISGMWSDISKNVKSDPFKQFVGNIEKDIPGAANALHNLGGAIGGIISQLQAKMPATGDKFINSFANMTKQLTPQAVTGLVNAAGAMATLMHTVSNISSSPITRGFGDLLNDVSSFFTNPGQGFNTSAISRQVTSLMPGTFHPKIQVQPQIDTKALQASLSGPGLAAAAAGVKAKAKVDVTPQADTAKMASDMQTQVSTAAKDVKVGGIKVSLADAKLSGMAALQSLMENTGKTAGDALDKGVTTGIQTGGAGAVAAMRSLISQIKAACAGLPAEFRTIGSQAAAGMAAGITAGIPAAVAAAHSLAEQVASAAAVHLKVSSPSKVFYEIGKNAVAGLVLGLEGGKSQVATAARDVAGLLTKPFTDATITDEIKKLITDVTDAWKHGQVSQSEKSSLVQYLQSDNLQLLALAKQRKDIEAEITAADALAKSVTSSAESGASLTSIVSAIGTAQQNIPGADTDSGTATSFTSSDLISGQKSALQGIRQFRNEIKELKKEGLSKGLIQQILGAGVSGGTPIAQAILQGGKGAVQQMNRLQSEINSASKALGVTGANAAYESGSQIGKGLAQGLRSELGEVTKAMKDLAKQIIQTVRDALGVHSPSQVMHDIGVLIAQGLTNGMDAGGSFVRGAAERLGRAAVPQTGPLIAATGAAGGGSSTTEIHHQPIILKVSGNEIARTVQTYTLRHARRNTASGLQLPGRRV